MSGLSAFEDVLGARAEPRSNFSSSPRKMTPGQVSYRLRRGPGGFGESRRRPAPPFRQGCLRSRGIDLVRVLVSG